MIYNVVFLLYSKVIQLYTYMFFFIFFFIIGYYKVLSIIPCTVQLERQWHPTPVLINPMDGRAWWAAVHGVTKSWARLSDFTFTFHFHALEKEMATPFSVLAWRIPGMGEPGGLPSVGSHRVRHD